MTKNPAEIAGTRYKNEKLMSRVQKTDGTSRCFAQIENIKRQSLGIRKAPDTNVKRENQKLFNPDSAEYMELNDWWYRCDFDYQNLDAEDISCKMKKDIEELKDKLDIE